MFDQLGLSQPAPLSITTLLANLALAGILVLLLSWHYMKYARTYTNRADLAWVLPFIALTTVLIISVVKSSLALSLGLVGALSIVRFRTPIKEPEELAYLFMAIAIGLGMGADQRMPTVVATLMIGLLLMLRSGAAPRGTHQNLYLNLEVEDSNGDKDLLPRINDMLMAHMSSAEMRRLDVRDGTLQATFLIDCKDGAALSRLMNTLNEGLPGASMSFIEQRGLPGA